MPIHPATLARVLDASLSATPTMFLLRFHALDYRLALLSAFVDSNIERISTGSEGDA
jgi:hypothetical protein